MTLTPLSATPNAQTRNFLVGGGIMGDLIRSKDWSTTPLGDIETWPQSLRTTVSLCLASNFPIDVIWGPQHTQIYNDGYLPICAGKHPQSLGEDFTQTWASAWGILDKAFAGALAGETSFLENQRTFLDRNGYLEETFFTFSLSPIRDESGKVGGLFHPVIETTLQMLSQRRTRALQDLASRPSEAKSLTESCELAAQALFDHQLDFPFALIYMVDEKASTARLCGSAHLEPGSAAAPLVVDLEEGNSPCAWPFREVMLSGAPVKVTDLKDKFGPLACGPYPETPATAFVLPMVISGVSHPAAFLVVAVSPRLPFNDEYRGFVNLAAATFTAGLLNARAYEQERKRAEKLAEIDAAKTAFFSNVSHEFRTPLTLMIGPLEELLASPADPLVTKRESIELVHRNSLRLLRLVNTLLDFSRIEADRVQAHYEPVDLASLTAGLASTFRSVVEKAGLSLIVNCPALGESIYVDRGMWEKIVLNLLSNAFKFTFEGTISVTILDHGGEVELAVSDTGTGIPAHELSKIFQRFHRVQGAPGRSYEGTGIGLALVESLVKLHSGSVRVESEVGKGTTFFVRIPKGFQRLPPDQVTTVPRSESAGSTAPAMFIEEARSWLPDTFTNLSASIAEHSIAEQANGTHPRRRVLLADDNADMRQYVQRILAPEFDVDAVSDGVQALSAVKERTPDLVLTDVMMPRLDGFGLLKELRNDRLTQGIPVVMLSARAGEEARVEGLQAGADDYLVKPFNARELLARVRVNLELSNLRKELFCEEEKRHGVEGMERQWRLFDTALSHSPDSIYIFDLNKRFTYANRALLDRWRKPLNDLLGKTLLEVGYPPGLAEMINQQLDQVIQNPIPLRNRAPLAELGGKERLYDYILVPVFSQTGTLEAIAGSSRDITEFIEKNRELQEANADLEQFAFSASHDLQAPLQVIHNVSNWLEEDLEEHLTPEIRDHLLLLRRRVNRMQCLLDDLLQYVRIGRKEDKGQKELIAGDALVADAIAFLPRAGFTINVSPAFAQIHVRRMPLQQILLNLIGNAIKHHHRRDGHIDVTVEESAARYEFAVKDDGPGIAPQFHEQIFKMFQTLKPKDQVEGSGMGLALVRKWLDLNGGSIRLESAEGQGSTFLFTWPKTTQLE